MIVAAACRAKADKIVTEDLNHGQQIDGVLIENPFLWASRYYLLIFNITCLDRLVSNRPDSWLVSEVGS